MIKGLQTLRGIGALLIFAHHFGFRGSTVLAFGDAAVALFMMLSGFVLTLAWKERVQSPECPTPFRFMKGRVMKFYPLYLVSLIFALWAVAHWHITPGPLIADLLLLQSWSPNPDYFFSGNAPAWFLSSLMPLYLLFLPLLRWMLRFPPRRLKGIVAVAITLYVCAIWIVPEGKVLWAIYIFPLSQLPAFMLGMFAALHGPRLSGRRADLLILFAFMLWVGQMLLYGEVTTRFTFGCYWWPVTALLLIAVAGSDRSRCLASRLLNLRLPVAFGDISFTFFILHFPWIYATRLLMTRLGLVLPLPLEFVLSALVLAFLCVPIQKLFERPWTLWRSNEKKHLQG